MKSLSLILSTLSLTVSVGLLIGAYFTYKKAEDIINNPEQIINKIVDNKMNTLLKGLSVPGIPKELPIKQFKIF
jgi:hypothetical protein